MCIRDSNTVVNALQTVLDKANGAKIPVFGSEIEQVKSGCVASMEMCIRDRAQTVCLSFIVSYGQIFQDCHGRTGSL